MIKNISVNQVRDMVINLDNQDLISDLDNIQIKPKKGRIGFTIKDKSFDFGFWCREDLVKDFILFVSYVRKLV